MQAFVQQPHQLMAGSQPKPQVLHSQIQGRATEQQSKRKHAKTSEPQFMGTPDHHQYYRGEQKHGKNLGNIQQAYYTYSQTATKHQSKADYHATSAYKPRAGQLSELGSLKRNTQTVHSDSSHGGTPKTPSVSNVFRRKWGGASSTKSLKSVSSNKSTQQTTQRVSQAITGFDEIPSKSQHSKKERNRPPSSASKTQGRESTRKESIEKALLASMPLEKLKTVQNLLQVANTPPASSQQRKTVRSSSNDIRATQIDFIAVNQQIKTKAQSNLSSQSKQAVNQMTPMKSSRHLQHQNLAPAQQMPPKPQSSAKATQKTGRKQSKSKSITRSHAKDALPPSGNQSQNNQRPIPERNMPHGQLGQGTSGAQSQQVILKTQDSAQSKSKKQRTLMQSGTVAQNNESNRGGDYTQGRDSSTKRARQRSRDAICDTQSLIARRISQSSPNKRNRASAATHQHSSGTRKHMTPVLQSLDKLPTQPPSTQGKIVKVGVVNNRDYADSDRHQQSYQGCSSHETPKEKDEDGAPQQSQQQQNQLSKVKSHRVQNSGAKEGSDKQPGLVQIPSKRNRHRSTSNKKQQATFQAHQTQATGTEYQGASQSDCKKKEGSGVTTKRKKSTTRRKSAKRKQQEPQQAPSEMGKRGRSPHHQAQASSIAEKVAAYDRHMSPPGGGTAQIYSAFRMRNLKPKKTATREKNEQLDSQQQKHSGSVSVERQNQIQVGFMGFPDKAANINDRKVLAQDGTSHQQLLQSASASNSLFYAKTYQTLPANKITKQRAPIIAQKQKMLTNIQQQVLASQKALTGVKRIKQDGIKKSNPVEKKKNAIVDLMKATLMTDIRIENRVAKQSYEHTQTPSQTSSVKSMTKYQPTHEKQSRKLSVKKLRSISSDERMKPSAAKDKQTNKDGNSSPKIILSLRQLEKLLFSTQQTMKSCSTTKGSSSAKKQIIYNSLKQFSQQQSESGKSRQTKIQQEVSTPNQQSTPLATTSQNFVSKTKQQSSNNKKKSLKTATTTQAFKNIDQHLVVLQPATMQVFNTISDRSSKGTATPNAGQKSNSSSMPQYNSMHDSVKMRTKSVEQRKETSQNTSQQLLLRATAKKIQDKINRQPQNLLSLVQGQKMRAQKMAAQAHKPAATTVSQHYQNEQDLIVDQQGKTLDRYENSMTPTQLRRKEKVATDNGDSGQSYRDFSEETPLQQEQADAAFSSSQRLQNLIYAKLESRQTDQNTDNNISQNANEESVEVNVVQAASPNMFINQVDDALPRLSSAEDAQAKSFNYERRKSEESSVASSKLKLSPEFRRDFKRKNQQTESDFLSLKSEICETSRSRSSQRRNEESFLNRVAKTGQTPLADEEEKSNTSTVSSFKQPSLRQITSSHTSRSNKNRLQRQDSAPEFRPSQDQNASITLSRILLETSMQQSERGNGNNNQNQQIVTDRARNSTMGINIHRFRRLGSENLMTPFNDRQQDRGSQESIRSGDVLSPSLQKQDSNEQLRSIPRSLTNPDKFSSQNSIGKHKNFMADEIWPTNSSHRQRTSSITSLTNSSPASRTLEQLQQQSFSPSVYHPVSPQQQMKQKLLLADGRSLQQDSEDPFMGADRQVLNKNDAKNGNQPSQQEEPHVQDQEAISPGKYYQKVEFSPAGVSESNIDGSAECSSPTDVAKMQETEVMISRGTSSPKRRRSPLKSNKLGTNKNLSLPGLSSNNCGAILQPIQLDSSLTVPKDEIEQDVAASAADNEISPPAIASIDNYDRCALLTTSFNNDDIEFSDNDQAQQPSSQQVSDQNNINAQIQPMPHRDIIGRGDTAAVQHMMTRSERGDESYEDAPFEKSQNEGLNLIMFQGNNNIRDENDDQEQFVENEEPESAQNLLSSINSQIENNSSPHSNQDAAVPQLTTADLATEMSPLILQVQSSYEDNPSQLAAIEDVLRLTPNTLEGIASLTSLDSDQMHKSQHQFDQEPKWQPQSEDRYKAIPGGPTSDLQSQGNIERARIVSSPLDLLSQESRFGVRSEKYTPTKECEPRTIIKMESKTAVEKKESDLDDGEVSADDNDVISPDQINFEVVERGVVTPLEMKASVLSSTIEFEEAVNTVDQLSDSTPKPPAIVNNNPFTAFTSAVQSHESGSQKLRSGGSVLDAKVSTNANSIAGSKQLYDIDSLNDIKKASDLASKKVEITNHIFEMLVSDVRENMFPQREEEEECVAVKGAPGAKKKKKRRAQRRVKKLDIMPKVKEIKDGLPVDVCLKRIQSAAKVKHSVNSGDFNSLSATQSLSISKDTGRSYLDQTKSKEQIEISSQFHEIEQVKQEQMDLLQKKIALHEEQSLTKPLEDDLKQLQTNLRGIKTTTDVVDSYLSTLFNTLLKGDNQENTVDETPLINYCEQDFLDDLATPLAQNAVQELFNVQVLGKQARDTLDENANQKLFAMKKIKLDGGKEKTDEQRERDEALEMALFGFSQQQHPVLSVELYLDIERQKDYVLLADSVSEVNVSMTESLSQDRDVTNREEPQERQIKKQKQNLVENQSMLAEWENIHNKVLFDAVNDALDEFRPYGLRGPPAPWSGQTRALTYRYSQNAREVLQQVRDKVVGLSKTFGGALANSELLREYHIRGPLEMDKLQMLREERLAIMMMQDVEETQHLWEDIERQETGVKVELADLILSHLTDEILDELNTIQGRKI